MEIKYGILEDFWRCKCTFGSYGTQIRPFLTLFGQNYGVRSIFYIILGCFFAFLSHFLCFRGRINGLFFVILEEKCACGTWYGDKIWYFGGFLIV